MGLLELPQRFSGITGACVRRVGVAPIFVAKAEVEVAVKPPKYEPFLVSRSDPFMELFHEVYQEVMGVEPLYAYRPGITDANVFGERKIPCPHLGLPRGNVHQPNEYIALGWLEPVSRMYALLAARYLVT